MGPQHWRYAATSMAGMDADMMGNMPPYAMGGMDATSDVLSASDAWVDYSAMS